MRYLAALSALLLAAAIAPETAAAQYVSHAHGPWTNRFSLEPYAGLYYDNAGQTGPSFDQRGFLGGVRLGFAVADRVRLLGDVGYSQTRFGEDGALPGAPTAFRSETWLGTVGAEFDVVTGDTRGALGLQAGNAWHSGGEGYTSSRVVAPGFAIYQRLAPRADLRLGVQDYIFISQDPVRHNFALTAGLTLR